MPDEPLQFLIDLTLTIISEYGISSGIFPLSRWFTIDSAALSKNLMWTTNEAVWLARSLKKQTSSLKSFLPESLPLMRLYCSIHVRIELSILGTAVMIIYHIKWPPHSHGRIRFQLGCDRWPLTFKILCSYLRWYILRNCHLEVHIRLLIEIIITIQFN